jgi:hypothetical protein
MNTPTSPIPPWHRPIVTPVVDTLVGDGAISLATDTSYLAQTAPKNPSDLTVPYVVTLADGNYKRQHKQIFIPADKVENTAKWRVTGNFVGFVSLFFDDVGQSAILMWDGSGWHKVGGQATTEDQ